MYEYKGNEFHIEEERGGWRRDTPKCCITDMEIHTDEVWLPEAVDGKAVHAWEIRKEIGVFLGVRVLHIPKSVKRISIRNDIFPNLELVEIALDNPSYYTDGRLIMEYDAKMPDSGRIVLAYCPVCKGEEIRIPDEIREIRDYAFSGTSYRRIIFPRTGLDIGPRAFVRSAWLREQDYPIVIGSLLYQAEEETECLTVPDGVRRIAPEVFDSGYFRELAAPFLPGWTLITRINDQGSLRSLVITSAHADLDIRLLQRLETLEQVTIAKGHPCYQTIDGVVYSADGRCLVYYPPFRKESCYVIPDGVCKIEESAFYRQRYLEELVMPDSVCQVGPRAFLECRLLRRVRMSRQIRRLPDPDPYRKGGVFEGCGSLTEISLPEQMAYLGSYAFYRSGLQHIELDEQLVQIGEYALMAVGLTQVHLPESVQYLGKGSLFYAERVEACEGSARGLVSALNAVWPDEKDAAGMHWERREVTVRHRDGKGSERFLIPKYLTRSAAYHFDMAWNNERIDYEEYDACLGDIEDTREKLEFARNGIARCRPGEKNAYADYLRRVSYKLAAGLLEEHREEEFLHFLDLDFLSKASLAKLVKLSSREGMDACTAQLLKKQG